MRTMARMAKSRIMIDSGSHDGMCFPRSQKRDLGHPDWWIDDYLPTTITVKLPGIIGGRGADCRLLAAGRGPKSADAR